MRSVAQGARLEVRYATEALQRCLERLESEYSAYQEKRDREAVFGYLAAVFQSVAWWYHVGRANEFAKRALHLQRSPAPKISDPFAAIIFCTADSNKVDFKTRSKWARVLRYARVFKDTDESLRDFVKVRGGINKCARRYSRRLGRSNRISD
jgi:hypothetical protein